MPGRVVEEAWDLSSVDTVAILAANRANSTASKWSDLWKYQVPTGEAHILNLRHHFSIYLDEGTGSTEAGAGDARLRIEVRDQSEQDSKTIFGPALYAVCKDFDDVTKMAKLDLQNDLAVEEKFWIVVMVYDATVQVVAYSYFNLETIRVRSSI